MIPDSYQQAWKGHSSQTRVTIDADLLLQELRRNQRNFRAAIFWRDYREAGIALLLLPWWIYEGVTSSLPWTWYLAVPILVWIAVFILVYRMRHKQKPSEPDEPLLHFVKNSLTQMEHQIWLLRNAIWWLLLPISISALAFFAQIAWLSRSGGWLTALVLVLALAVAVSVMAAVYILNRRTLRLDLEPRRQELLTLLTSLSDETTRQD